MSLTKASFSMVNGAPINVLDYGADPTGAVDSTAAIQAALDAAKATDFDLSSGDLGNEVVFPKGTYLVTSLTVGARTLLKFNGGVLSPLAPYGATSYDYLIKFDGQFCKVYDMIIDMQYSLKYRDAVYIIARNNHFVNCEVWSAKSAFCIGNPDWQTDPSLGTEGISEIDFYGCSTNWGLTAYRLFGQNTIIHVVGGQTYSYKLAIPASNPNYAAWQLLDSNTIVNCGGIAYVTGGYLSNFQANEYAILSLVQPVTTSPYYKNRYGETHLSNVGIETGALFFAEDDGTYPGDETDTFVLCLQGCAGFVSPDNTGYYIDAQANCQQRISIINSRFHGNNDARTCYSVSAPVHIEPSCFPDTNGVNFYETLSCRYMFGYSGFVTVNSSETSQSVTSTPSVFKTTVNDYTNTNTAIYSWYNSSTGEITIPVNDLVYDATIEVGAYYTSATLSDATSFTLFINGSQYLGPRTSIGIAPWGIFKVDKLEGGDVITVKIECNNNKTCDGSPANYLYMSGTLA